ncbi:MAG: LysM peptidoglycan-binding domain-containing protein [Clostridia bacterium]|nr:LysM peptidoglycan-binding domain-containing protein [Clostridia bacterium]
MVPAFVHAADYRVASGDSLYTIGNLFKTTSSNIMQRSGLSSDRIYPGQVLNVPAAEYTVKTGDTLYLIAQKYGISLYSLKKANNEWDDYIYPGQKLILPGIAPSQSITTVPQTTAKAVIPYTASDLDLLARLVTAEAESEPYIAKVGVAAVVINRVVGDGFADTIRDVIYEKSAGYYQFTPVVNGWINKPASESAKKAAYEALHGSDPTNGAMFYFDDSTTNRWLWSKTIALRSGKMVFVY